jgi:hypothetical protein
VSRIFSEDEFQALERGADILIPKTGTPGALEFQVPYFIALAAKNCLDPDKQLLIKKGLQQLGKPSPVIFSSLEKKEQFTIIKKPKKLH